MSDTVAGTLVDVHEQVGVRQIFGLIGESLNPLADAVRHSKIEWIGVRHEEGGARGPRAEQSSPASSASVAEQPGHLIAGLSEACRDHAPVLALSGDMPRKLRGTEYFQTTDVCGETRRPSPVGAPADSIGVPIDHRLGLAERIHR